MSRYLPAVVAALALLPAHLPAADEPEFNGRLLSAWVTMLKDDPVPRKRKAALVALGQIAAARQDKLTGQTIAVAVGKAVRSDASPAVRQQAAVILGQMRLDDAAAALSDLAEAMRAEQDPTVRKEVATALGGFGRAARNAVVPLSQGLKDGDPAVRAAAADALGRVGADARATAPELLPLLKDADPSVRQAAVFAVARVDPEDPAPAAAALLGLLKADPEPPVRREALLAFGFLGDRSEEVVSAVAAGLADADVEHRRQAALTLGKFGSAVGVVKQPLLTALRGDADKVVRLYLIRPAVAAVGGDPEAATPVLADRLKADPDFEVRVAAAEELGGFGPAGKSALPALRDARRDPQGKVREAATQAIRQIEKPQPKPAP